MKAELLMQVYYGRLSEKDRRHYAAVEAIKLGYGGVSCIIRLLGVNRNTIMKGIKELEQAEECAQAIDSHRQRKVGGGRKKKTSAETETRDLLIAFIEKHKGGSPAEANVYWISLRPVQIARMFYAAHQIQVSHGLIKRLLKELGYGFRKMSKQTVTGSYARRDEQFNIICTLIPVMNLGSPVLSMDCRKKERLGNLYRAGRCYCTQPVKVYDHDCEHLSEGKVIPHGIYDLQANKGYISIGNSSETAAFVVDNLLWWWHEYGIHQYPDAKNVLLLCDAGGANSYRHYAFKKELMRFATQTGLSVIVSHYPPCCSKWNPIEHRLFCHVHQAMGGIVFSDYETVKKMISQTDTSTGLKVEVRLNFKKYETGIKTDKTDINTKKILYHPLIPELNYRIVP
jgi:transposase